MLCDRSLGDRLDDVSKAEARSTPVDQGGVGLNVAVMRIILVVGIHRPRGCYNPHNPTSRGPVSPLIFRLFVAHRRLSENNFSEFLKSFHAHFLDSNAPPGLSQPPPRADRCRRRHKTKAGENHVGSLQRTFVTEVLRWY